MATSYPALVLGRTTWRLASNDGEAVEVLARGEWDGSDAEAVAGQIATHLQEAPLDNCNVALLLESDLTLTARFTLESPRQFRKPDAMLYHLEEWLPVAAEDLAATYVRIELHVLAIAALKPPLEELASHLEEAGCSIDLVMPVLPLAVETHFATATRNDPQSILWLQADGSGDLVELAGGKLIDWRYLPEVSPQLVHEWCFKQLERFEPLPMQVYHPRDVAIDSLEQLGTAVEYSVTEEDPLLEQAIETLWAIRQGSREPVSLLTGMTLGSRRAQHPLGRELQLLQLGIALLLAAVIWVNWQAGQTSRSASRQLQAAAEEVFYDTYPNATLRTGARSRLESELGKLSGVRGDSDEQEFSHSVLPLLYEFLSALPEEMRFRLLEVRIDDGEIHLTGEVRSFSDADRIATALRSRNLQVTPPTTQRLPNQGVSFRLIAAQSEDGSAAEGAVDAK